MILNDKHGPSVPSGATLLCPQPSCNHLRTLTDFSPQAHCSTPELMLPTWPAVPSFGSSAWPGPIYVHESGSPSCCNKQPQISVPSPVSAGDWGGHSWIRLLPPSGLTSPGPKVFDCLSCSQLIDKGRDPLGDWEGGFRGPVHRVGKLLYLISAHSPPARKWSVSEKVAIGEQSAYVCEATSSQGQAPHHLFPPRVLGVSSITAPRY